MNSNTQQLISCNLLWVYLVSRPDCKRLVCLGALPRQAHATSSIPIWMKAASPLDQIPPNAIRRKRDPLWRGGFSLGLDLGLSRTGLALSKGFSVRPLTVLELRGHKFETRLMEIAAKEEVDEFIIGVPKSGDGKETPQSNKVRSVAGRLAVLAAERGWRVYLQDEHGTSDDAMQYMIDMGLSKSTRQGKIDAYAATVCTLTCLFHILHYYMLVVITLKSVNRNRL